MGITFTNEPKTAAPWALRPRVSVGATFSGSVGGHTGVFVVGQGGWIMSLTDPMHMWAPEDCRFVADYRPVDLEITVKPK